MKKLIIFIGIELLLISGIFNSCKKDDNSIIKDGDGNIYTSVKIGKQVWMAENLKSTKYNNGTNIPLVTDGVAWGELSTPGYCWYNNDSVIYKYNGAIYNWYTVNTGKLCPTGWHIPSNDEWTTLTTFLGGLDIAGGKLKETGTTHWESPNTGAANESGFTALPSGGRGFDPDLGYVTFDGIGGGVSFWSSTEDVDGKVYWRSLVNYLGIVFMNTCEKYEGLFVRCLRD